jgi:hypothetical protein
VGLSSVGDDTSSVGDNANGWWAQTTPVANARQRVQSFLGFQRHFKPTVVLIQINAHYHCRLAKSTMMMMISDPAVMTYL